MADGANQEDFGKTLNQQLKKMQKRLEASEDALAKGGLDADMKDYHLKTVDYYREEIKTVRTSLISLFNKGRVGAQAATTNTATGQVAAAGEEDDEDDEDEQPNRPIRGREASSEADGVF